MMDKSGGLRKLIREINKIYLDESATTPLGFMYTTVVYPIYSTIIVSYIKLVPHTLHSRYDMVSEPSALPRNVKELQEHLKNVDKTYDHCSTAWAQGEADKFTGETFHVCIYHEKNPASKSKA